MCVFGVCVWGGGGGGGGGVAASIERSEVVMVGLTP